MMQTAISLESTVVASQNHVAADLADEVVILSLKNGEYYGLNAVGAKIWTMVQEPCRVATVRDRLLEEYPDVEPEQCTRETLALLEQLLEAELINLENAGER